MAAARINTEPYDALIQSEHFPQLLHVAYAIIFGFVAYGLSIFLYIRAQKELGAAKTSAYYAIVPFVGALVSFVILRESFCLQKRH